MLPGNNIAPLASAGIFLPNSHSSYGDDTFLRGGVNLFDGSKGIDFQTWHAHIVGGNTIRLEPLTSGSSVDLVISGVTAASVAFDRAMNPNYAYCIGPRLGGGCALKWFDTNVNAYVTTAFPNEKNILVVHDDSRDIASSTSDVICAYQRGHGVYWRQQRDRYSIEYTAAAAITSDLTAIGMGTQWRFLFRTSPA